MGCVSVTRKKLIEKNNAELDKMHRVLQMISDELNRGQRKKLLKNEEIKAEFDLHGVIYEE